MRAHTADELRNDGFLIARGNQHAVAVQLLRFEDFLLFKKRRHKVDCLVRVARHK